MCYADPAKGERSAWLERLKKGWMRCVPIHGDGSHRIKRI